MKHESILMIPPKTVDFIEKRLREEPRTEEECMGEDETLSYTAAFPDGYEMDIKLCGVQFCEGVSNLPYTEAVLFHHGSEVCCSEPDDSFLGTWTLNDHDEEYNVTVVRKMR